jgi:hypothetical protein
MSLVTGSRVGPYEIVAPLGAGGMGECCTARTTPKLGRDVAIKILPTRWPANPERRGRFEREARTPGGAESSHIAQIYGFEETRRRRARRPAPARSSWSSSTAQRLPSASNNSAVCRLDEAVAIARQIADALEAAPRSGHHPPRSQAREHQDRHDGT